MYRGGATIPPSVAGEVTPLELRRLAITPSADIYNRQPLAVEFAGAAPGLGTDYAGLVEASLTSVYHHSRDFSGKTAAPLYITGGAAGSPEIMRRIAAIWGRPVTPVEKGGAALGAAVAAAYAFFRSGGEELDIERFCAALLSRGETVEPRREDISAVHGPGGYLERFAIEEGRLIAAHQPG